MLIKAVIKQINKYFSDYDIHGEQIQQGFQEPCFFVQKLPDYRKKGILSYENTSTFDIQYFLEEDAEDKNKKYEAVGNQLYQILEYIETQYNGCNKILHGSQMYFEISDGVLHFYVTYSYYLQKTIIGDKMKTLDVEESVKNV